MLVEMSLNEAKAKLLKMDKTKMPIRYGILESQIKEEELRIELQFASTPSNRCMTVIECQSNILAKIEGLLC